MFGIKPFSLDKLLLPLVLLLFAIIAEFAIYYTIIVTVCTIISIIYTALYQRARHLYYCFLDKKHTVVTYTDTKCEYVWRYKGSKLHGYSKFYDSRGKIDYVRYYVDNHLDGPSFSYDKQNKIYHVQQYANGKLHGGSGDVIEQRDTHWFGKTSVVVKYDSLYINGVKVTKEEYQKYYDQTQEELSKYILPELSVITTDYIKQNLNTGIYNTLHS